MHDEYDQAPPPPDAADAGPSRSEQRRDALAVLALAGQLVALPPTRLARLGLPEELHAEITSCQRMHAHGARKRQLGFVAKKLRQRDDAELGSLRAALGTSREQQHQQTAAMHRLEALREQLLAGDESALSAFINAHPQVDRQHLRSLLRKARSEKAQAKPPRAYREVFHLLQSLDTPDAGP